MSSEIVTAYQHVIDGFKYADGMTGNVLSQYLYHRLEGAADYVTNGAWKKILEKTAAKLKGKTIEAEPNLALVDEILKRTELQTDENLTELWARLLANALQGKNSVRREYFDILEKLNSYDVLVLNAAMDERYIDFLKEVKTQGHSVLIKGKILSAAYKFLKENYNLGDLDEIELSALKLSGLEVFTSESKRTAFSLTLLGRGLKKALF
ncbi:Abi-alpha family protein [Acetobacter thailandicus]|uniref:Abi-alpha family protein n=1 Tax=Acetobacter thailandicus TaxID=1502842 RepID=UPI001BA4A7D2|nr:Abi-alpha family protein [Acetobacter thailandicus]MBS0980105.1 DUF4393 domain-containing protein [Acetobacter thailandicus]